MAKVIESIKEVFAGKVPHETPALKHSKKIVFALTSASPQMPDHRSGWFWAELLHPVQVITEAGWDYDIVSENGAALVDEASIGKMASASDKKHWEDKEYPLHKKLAQLRPVSAVNPADYTAFFAAGGHGCVVDFPTASGLQKLAATIYENGGVVAAVCHGPALFQNLTLSSGKNILEGREATGFSTKGEEAMPGVLEWMRKNNYRTMEEVVKGAGATWSEHKTNPMGDYTVDRDRVCTGMNPASAGSVAKNMLAFLPKENEYDPKNIIQKTVADATQKDSSLAFNQEKARVEALEGDKHKTFVAGEPRV